MIQDLFTSIGREMAIEKKEQILNQIDQAKSILLVLKRLPSTDDICSALTLFDHLKKQQKEVFVFAQNFSLPEKLKFLPFTKKISSEINGLKKCIIEVDTNKSPLSDLTYSKTDNSLRIILTPKEGNISKENISIKEEEYLYDLIITIGVTEKSSIGEFYKTNREFFDHTPIINLDHKPENEQYGQINLVDINKTSISEMLYEFLFTNSKPNKEIANLILAGIMAETHAFRTNQMTAKTLKLVGALLEAGADHQKIVTQLYRTKSIGLLKLWGHVFDHLQTGENGLVWATIPESVFELTKTSKHDLQELHHEILSHTPVAKLVLLFIEQKAGIEVNLHTKPPFDAKELLKHLQPIGDERNAKAFVKDKSSFDILNSIRLTSEEKG